MKNLILLVIAIFISANVLPQEIKGRSGEYNFNITKDPPKPPYLEILAGTITLSERDGNAAIDANEEASLKFSIKNSGVGDGLGLKLLLAETTNAPGLSFEKEMRLNDVKVGKSMEIEVPIRANINTENGTAIFQITVKEPNGFDSDPVVVEVATRAFLSPQLIIADYAVQNTSGNRIQKRRPFDVQVLVQNTGAGNAENANIKISLPENMYCLSANESKSLGSLKPGDAQTITYNLTTNNDYSSAYIPLKFEISERYGKYGQSREVTMEINQEIAVKELQIEATPFETVRQEITVGTLTSVVDKNIPAVAKRYPNRLALIIGNENYNDFQMGLSAEMNVAFARNDAAVFRQYTEKVLGVEERNIFFITDATSGKMNKEINKVTAILSRMGNDAELIFYYAGHGFPDENTRTPYLMPVDVSAANLSSAIKLGDVYQKLAATGARITIFLDACFSGGGRESGLLAARGVKVKPREDALSGKMVVFSASTGEQSSLPNQSEKHGMFTYFLLKKLQETQGNISLQSLADYLNREVSIESIRKNGKEQDPTVLVSPELSNVWGSWQLNP
ncbi:MAG: caspase family protein [Bacteroidales bacterium]|nr:caspase family protein [Bacteroidales bacterium]